MGLGSAYHKGDHTQELHRSPIHRSLYKAYKASHSLLVSSLTLGNWKPDCLFYKMGIVTVSSPRFVNEGKLREYVCRLNDINAKDLRVSTNVKKNSINISHSFYTQAELRSQRVKFGEQLKDFKQKNFMSRSALWKAHHVHCTDIGLEGGQSGKMNPGRKNYSHQVGEDQRT